MCVRDGGKKMRARNEERNKQVLEDRRAGLSYNEIARKYGLSKARARTIIFNQQRWEHEDKIVKIRRQPERKERHTMRCMKCGSEIYPGAAFAMIVKDEKVLGYMCLDCSDIEDDAETKKEGE